MTLRGPSRTVSPERLPRSGDSSAPEGEKPDGARSSSPDPASGLDEQGNWTPAFSGQRPPAQPGNALALKHGSYSSLVLAPRAGELADEVRELAPRVLAPADEPMIRAFGVVLAQIERANQALESAKPSELLRLSEDLRAWLGQALKFAAAFGMSPASRMKLGLSAARTGLTLTQLAAALEDAKRERE